VRIALAGLLLLLAACSPSRQIAEAANSTQTEAIAIRSAALKIESLSANPTVKAHAIEIVGRSDTIVQNAATIHTVLPGVEDQVPWWAALLKWLAGAVVVVGVAVILFQTGIGAAIRAAIGWIPRRKVQEANLAAAALDPSRAEGLRELIAARRASDPLFDAAWRRETHDGNAA
jgi:hypothetical protein